MLYLHPPSKFKIYDTTLWYKGYGKGKRNKDFFTITHCVAREGDPDNGGSARAPLNIPLVLYRIPARL